jgi:putative transposase
VTVAEQRDAVHFLVVHGVSQRRACALVQLHRSTFQYQPRPNRNAELERQLQELAQRHPRYGYRRVWAVLRRHQRVNKKRIHRLWTRAKLQVRRHPRKRRPPRLLGVPIQATPPGHVWTYDFIHDRCLNGTQLKVLTVMDEFTREGLAIEVATSLPAAKVIPVLARLFQTHGPPSAYGATMDQNLSRWSYGTGWRGRRSLPSTSIPAALGRMATVRALMARCVMHVCTGTFFTPSRRPASFWKPFVGSIMRSDPRAAWGIEPQQSLSAIGHRLSQNSLDSNILTGPEFGEHVSDRTYAVGLSHRWFNN